MKTTIFAIFNKRGFVKANKTKGTRAPNEKGLLIEVEIDDSIFDDGHIHASIKVPSDAFVLPSAIVTIAKDEEKPE